MGHYSKFPAPSDGKQAREARSCCREGKGKNLIHWRCGCTWGCDACYATVKCKVCGALFNNKIAQRIRRYDENIGVEK